MADLPSGRGTFIIKGVFAKDKDGGELFTKGGQAKVMLMLEVTDAKKRTAKVWEHIVETDNADWKREGIFTACGKAHLRMPGRNDNLGLLEGLDGECIIEIDTYLGKAYPKIKKYLPASIKEAYQAQLVDDDLAQAFAQSEASFNANAGFFDDSDIPF